MLVEILVIDLITNHGTQVFAAEIYLSCHTCFELVYTFLYKTLMFKFNLRITRSLNNLRYTMMGNSNDSELKARLTPL